MLSKERNINAFKRKKYQCFQKKEMLIHLKKRNVDVFRRKEC